MGGSADWVWSGSWLRPQQELWVKGLGFLQLVLTSTIGGSPTPFSNNSWTSKMMKITLWDGPS